MGEVGGAADGVVWSAVLLSLRVSLVATLASLPVALVTALYLARGGGWVRAGVNILVHLPLVLPPVATGYVLLILLGRRGVIGAWLESTFGFTFAFQWTGAALAAAIMAFPLMVRAIRLSVDAVDPKLGAAAATLGASRAARFRTITLPLMVPGVLAGSALTFAKALGEFGATITFVSNIPGETQTLSLAIHTLLQVPGGEDRAMILILIALAIAALAVGVSEALARTIQGRRSRA